VWVVFNGEIYNFRALRRALQQRGHKFATSSDTEVIVHLYEEHGDAFVDHLRGMFAVAVWDRRRRTLTLAKHSSEFLEKMSALIEPLLKETKR